VNGRVNTRIHAEPFPTASPDAALSDRSPSSTDLRYLTSGAPLPLGGAPSSCIGDPGSAPARGPTSRVLRRRTIPARCGAPPWFDGARPATKVARARGPAQTHWCYRFVMRFTIRCELNNTFSRGRTSLTPRSRAGGGKRDVRPGPGRPLTNGEEGHEPVRCANGTNRARPGPPSQRPVRAEPGEIGRRAPASGRLRHWRDRIRRRPRISASRAPTALEPLTNQ